jgi:hypothetical protein
MEKKIKKVSKRSIKKLIEYLIECKDEKTINNNDK